MLRRAFQYAIHAFEDQNYPYSNRAWIEQAMRKIEWVQSQISNEKIVTALLLADVIRASDSTIDVIRSTFGDDIAGQVTSVMLNIDTEADATAKAETLSLLNVLTPAMKKALLITLIIDVENYVNETDYVKAVKFLDDRMSMINVLKDDDDSLYQQARQCVLKQRSTYRFKSVLDW